MKNYHVKIFTDKNVPKKLKEKIYRKIEEKKLQ